MSNVPNPPEVQVCNIDAVNAWLKLVPGIEPGSQSRVGLIDLANKPEPLLLKQMGSGKGLDYDEALSIHGNYIIYRQQLIDAGWNIPHLHESALANVEDEWQIWGVEQLIEGTNAVKLFEHPHNDIMKLHVVKQIGRTLAGYCIEDTEKNYLYGRDLTMLPHGIDLKPENVMVDRLGFVWMVDTFGPKLIDKKVTLVHIVLKLIASARQQ